VVFEGKVLETVLVTRLMATSRAGICYGDEQYSFPHEGQEAVDPGRQKSWWDPLLALSYPALLGTSSMSDNSKNKRKKGGHWVCGHGDPAREVNTRGRGGARTDKSAPREEGRSEEKGGEGKGGGGNQAG